MNKRSTLVTFASAAVLLGLFNINNSLTVKADTVEQPAVGQRNTQAATTNDQNNKSDQNQAQTNQNNDVATDQPKIKQRKIILGQPPIIQTIKTTLVLQILLILIKTLKTK